MTLGVNWCRNITEILIMQKKSGLNGKGLVNLPRLVGYRQFIRITHHLLMTLLNIVLEVMRNTILNVDQTSVGGVIKSVLGCTTNVVVRLVHRRKPIDWDAVTSDWVAVVRILVVFVGSTKNYRWILWILVTEKTKVKIKVEWIIVSRENKLQLDLIKYRDLCINWQYLLWKVGLRFPSVVGHDWWLDTELKVGNINTTFQQPQMDSFRLISQKSLPIIF